MRLKVFYLGLLSTFVMATTQTEGLQRRLVQAPELQQKVQQHEQTIQQHQEVERKAIKRLDVAAHGNDPVAALKDLTNNLGTVAAHPNHATANERLTDALGVTGQITDTHTARGTLADPLHPPLQALNPRLEAILARLKAGIAACHLDHGEYRLRTLDTTKTEGTAAGAAPHANDMVAVNGAGTIEDFLTELGW